MMPQGLLALYEPTLATNIKPIEIIESFLDAEAVPFIMRSTSFTKENYSRLIKEVDVMATQMEFDYLIHHHVDLLEQTKATGIHLTAASEPITEVRDKIGPDMIIGYSAHSFEEAVKAKQSGANYIILGSVYETPKKYDNHPIIGLETLKKACKRLEIPIYAVGGIDSSNLIEIRQAGAAGFCSLRAVYQNQEIEHNISKLMFIWEDF